MASHSACMLNFDVVSATNRGNMGNESSQKKHQPQLQLALVKRPGPLPGVVAASGGLRLHPGRPKQRPNRCQRLLQLVAFS